MRQSDRHRVGLGLSDGLGLGLSDGLGLALPEGVNQWNARCHGGRQRLGAAMPLAGVDSVRNG